MASRAPEPGKGPKGELRTSIYSAKALIVQGDTFPHREKLLEMGGSFVKGKGVKGFVFSRRVRAKQVRTRGLSPDCMIATTKSNHIYNPFQPQLDAWLRRMGQPGVPPEALKSVPAGKQESAPKPRAASAGGKKEKKQKRRRVVVEEEEDEEEGGSESDVPKARKRLKRPKQQKEKKQKQRRRREASSSEEEEESSAWDDDSEEEDGSYEGESDSEEELWAEVMGEERGGGGGGKGKGKSKSKAVAARGRGVRVGGERCSDVDRGFGMMVLVKPDPSPSQLATDVADHILGRMGLGGGGGSTSTKKPSKSSSKAKKPSTKKSGSKKKVPKLGQGDETDFPELLPTVASSKHGGCVCTLNVTWCSAFPSPTDLPLKPNSTQKTHTRKQRPPPRPPPPGAGKGACPTPTPWVWAGWARWRRCRRSCWCWAWRASWACWS